MLSFNSALGKIQATVATNARLIKHERSRLELISRMAGISLSDSLSTKPRNTSHLSLGGSVIPLDREQRDAMFYRLLCSGGVKSKGKESKRKINPIADQRIPVVKAPSAVTDVLASMRMLEEAKSKTPVQSTPKLPSMNKSVDKSASTLTPSVTTNKLPTPPSKQLSKYCDPFESFHLFIFCGCHNENAIRIIWLSMSPSSGWQLCRFHFA